MVTLDTGGSLGIWYGVRADRGDVKVCVHVCVFVAMYKDVCMQF